MSPRSSLLSFLASAALASTAAADRLIVSGQDGFLYQADTATGVFEPFSGPCISPLTHLAADGQNLYGLSEFGTVFVFDLASGAMLNWLFPTVGTPNSLAAAPEGLFVGTAEGDVVRLDPASGAVLDTRTTPDGVRVLLAHQGMLYAASTNGAVYRAPAAGGAFDYFSCFCFFNITTMATDAGHLVVADENGTVVRIDLATGNLLTGFSLFGSHVAGMSDGVLLLYYDGGVIPLANSHTGAAMPGHFQAPGTVTSLFVLDLPTGPRVRSRGKLP